MQQKKMSLHYYLTYKEILSQGPPLIYINLSSLTSRSSVDGDQLKGWLKNHSVKISVSIQKVMYQKKN